MKIKFVIVLFLLFFIEVYLNLELNDTEPVNIHLENVDTVSPGEASTIKDGTGPIELKVISGGGGATIEEDEFIEDKGIPGYYVFQDYTEYGIPTGTHYFHTASWQEPVSLEEVFVTINKKLVAKSIHVKAETPSGITTNTVFTVRKNGIDTAMQVYFNLNQHDMKKGFYVPFEEGDKISVQIIDPAGSAISHVTIIIDTIILF